MQGNRTADRDPRQCDLAGDPELIEQGRDVVGHRIEGKLAAHLLRHSGAAGVVAQDTARFRELWRDVLPAFERAAHFVNQHQRAVAAAAQLAAQPDAIGLNEIHPAPPGCFFVVCHGERSASKSEVHDTRDDMKLKLSRCGATGGHVGFLAPVGDAGIAAAWADEPALGRTDRSYRIRCGGPSGLMCRFVAVDLKMLNRQRPVMCRHLLVMLP